MKEVEWGEHKAKKYSWLKDCEVEEKIFEVFLYEDYFPWIVATEERGIDVIITLKLPEQECSYRIEEGCNGARNLVISVPDPHNPGESPEMEIGVKLDDMVTDFIDRFSGPFRNDEIFQREGRERAAIIIRELERIIQRLAPYAA